MLEEFNDLISTLCANSPITQEEHRDRLFFTNDGLIFDSFWESNDNYRFGTSERPSRVGATLRTPSSTVARYELVRLLGGYNRWSHGRQAVELAADPDSLQASWTISPGQLFGEQILSMRSCPDVEFTSFDEQRAYKLAHLMQYPFEDALQLYLGE
ncbi:MAG: hypothetical protein ACFNXV_02060 [Pauljensenia sp.]